MIFYLRIASAETDIQHSIPVRHCHHPRPHMAELDMSVVARQGKVSVAFGDSTERGELICSPKDADYTIHRMILGTHTSGQAGDHLMIAEVFLPKSAMDMTRTEVAEMYDEERQGRSQTCRRKQCSAF